MPRGAHDVSPTASTGPPTSCHLSFPDIVHFSTPRHLPKPQSLLIWGTAGVRGGSDPLELSLPRRSFWNLLLGALGWGLGGGQPGGPRPRGVLAQGPLGGRARSWGCSLSRAEKSQGVGPVKCSPDVWYPSPETRGAGHLRAHS